MAPLLKLLLLLLLLIIIVVVCSPGKWLGTSFSSAQVMARPSLFGSTWLLWYPDTIWIQLGHGMGVVEIQLLYIKSETSETIWHNMLLILKYPFIIAWLGSFDLHICVYYVTTYKNYICIFWKCTHKKYIIITITEHVILYLIWGSRTINVLVQWFSVCI